MVRLTVIGPVTGAAEDWQGSRGILFERSPGPGSGQSGAGGKPLWGASRQLLYTSLRPVVDHLLGEMPAPVCSAAGLLCRSANKHVQACSYASCSSFLCSLLFLCRFMSLMQRCHQCWKPRRLPERDSNCGLAHAAHRR
ncbi:hypothetical protein SETIT_4G108800v2 [Setaria italica]|uniref:Uncharacterized protein n=1 Tax=Setaria italica TaxID=4555 RepID=A0A368QTI2_SETIT|nr:hypothetical protein SETIT_4G108800v2 [Setaria italica]